MKVEDNEKNLKRCICNWCPTQNGCMKEKKQGFACARGKVTCVFEKKGCVCGGCLVHFDNKLTGEYYCENGEAK